MAKTPEQIQKDLIERFGLQIDIEKCKNYSQAYSVISNLATIGYINVVNEGKLKEVVGKREDFQKALNENEHIENKSVKAFYFYHYSSNPLSLGKERVATLPLNSKDSKAMDNINLKIIRLASEFGLIIGNEDLKKLITDKNIINNAQIDEEMFLECVLTKNNEYNFKVINQSKARKALEKLSFGLGIYKDEFAINFLGEHLGSELRKDKEEDKFLRSLDEKGVYVTYLGDGVPPITNMKDLENALANNPSEVKIVGLNTINIYEELGDYMIENPQFEGLIANNISKTLMSEERASEGAKKIEDFENLLGIKIYFYNADISGKMTMDRIIKDIISGDAKFLVCDIDKLKENMNGFPTELQEAFGKMIKEKEIGLTIAQKVKDEENEKKPKEADDKEKKVLYDTTASEKNIESMILEKYRLYGKDYTIYAMDLCIKENNFEEFPKNKDEFSNEEILKALGTSYTKRVLRRMKEKKLGDNENPKENLLEKAIVEIYQQASQKYDAQFSVDFISNCFCERILNKKDKIFPEGSFYTSEVNANISQEDILKIMLDSEINEALHEKDNNGKSIITEKQVDESLRRYENLENRLELSENKFINNTNKKFKTDTEKSSASATIYASLSQNGVGENAKIVELIKSHNALNQKIKTSRKELLDMKIKLNKTERDSAEYKEIEAKVKILEEKLKQVFEEYNKFMIEEKYTDKNGNQREKLMVIGEYESKIKALKELDAQRPGKQNYINNKVKSEVIDIE